MSLGRASHLRTARCSTSQNTVATVLPTGHMHTPAVAHRSLTPRGSRLDWVTTVPRAAMPCELFAGLSVCLRTNQRTVRRTVEQSKSLSAQQIESHCAHCGPTAAVTASTVAYKPTLLALWRVHIREGSTVGRPRASLHGRVPRSTRRALELDLLQRLHVRLLVVRHERRLRRRLGQPDRRRRAVHRLYTSEYSSSSRPSEKHQSTRNGRVPKKGKLRTPRWLV
jgi:hypothetical protein